MAFLCMSAFENLKVELHNSLIKDKILRYTKISKLCSSNSKKGPLLVKIYLLNRRNEFSSWENSRESKLCGILQSYIGLS